MDDNIDEGEIRCFCGSTEDDGYTVQCDKCLIWQHVKCVLARNNGQPLPDIYYCEECDPKKNDQKKNKLTIKKQNKSKKDMIISLPHNVGRPPKIHSSKKEQRSAYPYPSSQSGRKSRELGHGRSKSQARNEGKSNKNSRQLSPESTDRNINFQKSYEFYVQNYTVIKNNLFENKEIQNFISSKINNSKLKNKIIKYDDNSNNYLFDIDNKSSTLIYIQTKLRKASVTVRPIPSRISIFDHEFNHYGLFAAADIPKNTYLCDIKGTIKYKSNISSIYSFYHNDINDSTNNLSNISGNENHNDNFSNINSNNLNENKENKKSCFIMDPFIFVHPAQELDSLIVDSREYGNDGRFIRFYCEGGDMIQNPNAQLQSIMCPEYSEKSSNNNQIEKEKKYKLKLAVISSHDIKKGDEIILSTSENYKNEKWFGYPCICGDRKDEIKDTETSLSSIPYNSNCIIDSLLNENSKFFKKLNYFGNYNNKSFIIDETLNEWIKRTSNRQKKNDLSRVKKSSVDKKNKNISKSKLNTDNIVNNTLEKDIRKEDTVMKNHKPKGGKKLWMKNYYKEQKKKENVKKWKEEEQAVEVTANNENLKQSKEEKIKQEEINKLKEQLFSEEINEKEKVIKIKSEENNEGNNIEKPNIKKEKSEIEIENEKNTEFLKQLFDEPKEDDKMNIDKNIDDMNVDIDSKSEYSESNSSPKDSENYSKRKEYKIKSSKKIRKSSIKSDISNNKTENDNNLKTEKELNIDKNSGIDSKQKRKRINDITSDNNQNFVIQKKIKTEEKIDEEKALIKNEKGEINNNEESTTAKSEISGKSKNKNSSQSNNEDKEISERQNSSSNTHNTSVRKVSLRDYKLKRGSTIGSISNKLNKKSSFSLFNKSNVTPTSSQTKPLENSYLLSDSLSSITSSSVIKPQDSTQNNNSNINENDNKINNELNQLTSIDKKLNNLNKHPVLENTNNMLSTNDNNFNASSESSKKLNSFSTSLSSFPLPTLAPTLSSSTNTTHFPLNDPLMLMGFDLNIDFSENKEKELVDRELREREKERELERKRELELSQSKMKEFNDLSLKEKSLLSSDKNASKESKIQGKFSLILSESEYFGSKSFISINKENEVGDKYKNINNNSNDSSDINISKSILKDIDSSLFNKDSNKANEIKPNKTKKENDSKNTKDSDILNSKDQLKTEKLKDNTGLFERYQEKLSLSNSTNDNKYSLKELKKNKEIKNTKIYNSNNSKDRIYNDTFNKNNINIINEERKIYYSPQEILEDDKINDNKDNYEDNKEEKIAKDSNNINNKNLNTSIDINPLDKNGNSKKVISFDKYLNNKSSTIDNIYSYNKSKNHNILKDEMITNSKVINLSNTQNNKIIITNNSNQKDKINNILNGSSKLELEKKTIKNNNNITNIYDNEVKKNDNNKQINIASLKNKIINKIKSNNEEKKLLNNLEDNNKVHLTVVVNSENRTISEKMIKDNMNNTQNVNIKENNDTNMNDKSNEKNRLNESVTVENVSVIKPNESSKRNSLELMKEEKQQVDTISTMNIDSISKARTTSIPYDPANPDKNPVLPDYKNKTQDKTNYEKENTLNIEVISTSSFTNNNLSNYNRSDDKSYSGNYSRTKSSIHYSKRYSRGMSRSVSPIRSRSTRSMSSSESSSYSWSSRRSRSSRSRSRIRSRAETRSRSRSRSRSGSRSRSRGRSRSISRLSSRSSSRSQSSLSRSHSSHSSGGHRSRSQTRSRTHSRRSISITRSHDHDYNYRERERDRDRDRGKDRDRDHSWYSNSNYHYLNSRSSIFDRNNRHHDRWDLSSERRNHDISDHDRNRYYGRNWDRSYDREREHDRDRDRDRERERERERDKMYNKYDRNYRYNSRPLVLNHIESNNYSSRDRDHERNDRERGNSYDYHDKEYFSYHERDRSRINMRSFHERESPIQIRKNNGKDQKRIVHGYDNSDNRTGENKLSTPASTPQLSNIIDNKNEITNIQNSTLNTRNRNNLIINSNNSNKNNTNNISLSNLNVNSNTSMFSSSNININKSDNSNSINNESKSFTENVKPYSSTMINSNITQESFKTIDIESNTTGINNLSNTLNSRNDRDRDRNSNKDYFKDRERRRDMDYDSTYNSHNNWNSNKNNNNRNNSSYYSSDFRRDHRWSGTNNDRIRNIDRNKIRDNQGSSTPNSGLIDKSSNSEVLSTSSNKNIIPSGNINNSASTFNQSTNNN